MEYKLDMSYLKPQIEPEARTSNVSYSLSFSSQCTKVSFSPKIHLFIESEDNLRGRNITRSRVPHKC